MTDARFEDSREAPLNLGALDAEDLSVISALVQDSVFPASEMRWERAANRFVLLINRFRWEEGPARVASPERVQSLLVFEGVTAVASNGIDRKDTDTVLSILSTSFEETEAPAGHVLLTLAGDGAIRLAVEALEVTLKDVTKPYQAPSKKTPQHPE
ncbi:DUF2948 family protein [uncultured Roseobacter sp.]|uniref:DUF2948 family protein n=1 Tax=uncultured Roseobacter sp. TaxID=114847 RepID=UPI00263674E9|nr:DUF2948 family protein [uncultured Roseobacter sp.]